LALVASPRAIASTYSRTAAAGASSSCEDTSDQPTITATANSPTEQPITSRLRVTHTPTPLHPPSPRMRRAKAAGGSAPADPGS
jgi:hypothetical protein